MTLRSRVVLIVTSLVVIGVGLASLLAYRSTDAELVQETDRFLLTRADELIDGQRQPPPNPRGDRSDDDRDGDDDRDSDDDRDDDRDDQPDKLASDPDALSQTIDRSGRIIATSDKELPVEDVDRAVANGADTVLRDIDLDGDPYRMATAPDPGGGAVQVATLTSAAADVLQGLQLRLVLIGLVVAVLAAVLGWLLMRRTTQPLEDLAAATERVATTRDLTPLELTRTDEVGRLADSFDRMLVALALSREQQHRLVQDAAHELRTPLTSLRANIELLQRAPDLPREDVDEVIVGLNEEVAELTELFSELIQLATDTSADRTDVEFDLAAVVEDAAERFRRRSGRDVRVDTEPTVVTGSPTALDRAVTNLLGNADKFSGVGAPIDVRLSGRWVMVRDRGPGIDDADAAHVFDRFYRAPSARSLPGSGLGLAIVKQIAEQHAGSVVIRPAEGGGTEVGFSVGPPGTAPGRHH